MVAITPQLRSVKSLACLSLTVAIDQTSSYRVEPGQAVLAGRRQIHCRYTGCAQEPQGEPRRPLVTARRPPKWWRFNRQIVRLVREPLRERQKRALIFGLSGS